MIKVKCLYTDPIDSNIIGQLVCANKLDSKTNNFATVSDANARSLDFGLVVEIDEEHVYVVFPGEDDVKYNPAVDYSVLEYSFGEEMKRRFGISNIILKG